MPLQNAFANLSTEAKQDTILTSLASLLTELQQKLEPGGAVRDDYQAGEVLADQNGAGAVLTFTFSAAVQLVVVTAKGTNLTARADPFGGIPSGGQGIVCDDGVPTYIPVTATVVKVFAPSGMAVTVFGMRRA